MIIVDIRELHVEFVIMLFERLNYPSEEDVLYEFLIDVEQIWQISHCPTI